MSTIEEQRELVAALTVLCTYGQSIRPYAIGVDEAAAVLGISRRSFLTHVAPRLTTVLIGSRRLVPLRELDAYLDGLIADQRAADRPTVAIAGTTADRVRRLNERHAAATAAPKGRRRRTH